MSDTWEQIQAQSNQILADGIWQIQNCKACALTDVTDSISGNYLISHGATPMYIGEAKNLKSRLKQHTHLTRSQFYKNYLKKISTHDLPQNLKIEDFTCQIVPTKFGRKEIEEFGIVNIPTPLNSSQLGKRSTFPITSHDDVWHRVQSLYDEWVQAGDTQLQTKPLVQWHNMEAVPQAGVYWIEHPNFGLMYIGESSNFGIRFKNQHSKYTRGSAFRRWVGVDILGFQLTACTDGRIKCFSPEEDATLNQFLQDCWIQFMPVNIGRYEFEEYLIKKYQPHLNRKAKK